MTVTRPLSVLATTALALCCVLGSTPAAAAPSRDVPGSMVLLSQVMRDYPDTFAGGRILPDGSAELSFKGDVPAAVRNAGVKGVVTRGGAPFSEREVYEAMNADLHALSMQPGTEAIGSPDATGYTITLVTDNTRVTAAADSPTRTAVAEQTIDNRPVANGMTRRIDHTTERPRLESHLAGYRYHPFGGGYCSTAFPVKKINEPPIGVLTAGHCGDGNLYENQRIFQIAPYSRATVFNNEWWTGGDFRWLWSTQMFSGRTRLVYDPANAASGPIRTFTSAGHAYIGDVVCRTGWKTPVKCGYLTHKSETILVDVGDFPGRKDLVGPLDCTSSTISAPGDSGGPWYYGDVALGIHTGRLGVGGGAQVSCYSRVPNALQRFGLQLWTGQ